MNTTIMNTAPVAIFTYDRLDTLKQTVECLKSNTLAAQTDVYVFSDGWKDDATSKNKVSQVRAFLHTLKEEETGRGFRNIEIVERPGNFYLERNIVEGVTQMVSRLGAVIVLEDDICTGPHFLKFMNDALSRYEADERVMHVTGFTNLCIPEKGDIYFTPHMAGWGWATWGDRWLKHFKHYTSRAEALEGLSREDLLHIEYGGKFHCLQSLDRTPIPWDICWELAIYRQKGLCLAPTQTLVRNCGISGGTHFQSMRLFGHYSYDRPFSMRRFDVEADHVAPDKEIEEVLYPKALTDHGFIYNPLGKAVRAMLHLVKK
jgi:hypothetical protein